MYLSEDVLVSYKQRHRASVLWDQRPECGPSLIFSKELAWISVTCPNVKSSCHCNSGCWRIKLVWEEKILIAEDPGEVGLAYAPARHRLNHLNQTGDMKPLSKVKAEEWAVLFQVGLFLTVIGKVNNRVKTVHNSYRPNKSCHGTRTMVFINNEQFFLHLNVAF